MTRPPGWDADEQPVYQAEPPPAYLSGPYPGVAGAQQGYQGYPAPPGYRVQPDYPPPGAYGYPPQPYGWHGSPPPMVSEPGLGWALVGFGALCVIGATGTWARVLDLSYTGTSFGAGKVVALLSVAVVVCGLVIAAGRGSYGASVTACVAAILVALLGLVNLLGSGTLIAQYHGLIRIGWGLWLTVAAGTALAATSILALMRRRPRTAG